MIRALTILAVIAALAVSAAPASEARVGGKMHYDSVELGTGTDNAWESLTRNIWWWPRS
jgi:hypothetical protein